MQGALEIRGYGSTGLSPYYVLLVTQRPGCSWTLDVSGRLRELGVCRRCLGTDCKTKVNEIAEPAARGNGYRSMFLIFSPHKEATLEWQLSWPRTEIVTLFDYGTSSSSLRERPRQTAAKQQLCGCAESLPND